MVHKHRKAGALLVVGALLLSILGSTFLGFIIPVSGVVSFSRLWSRNLGAAGSTTLAPLAADLDRDGDMEIVLVGGTYGGSSGYVTVLNGKTGATIWQKRPGGVGQHSGFDIADLDKDGYPEIIISAKTPLVLRGRDGSVYWRNTNVPAGSQGLYQAVADIDGNGYPTVFVSSGQGPFNGYDYVTSLSYDGKILNQAFSWHPCYGGLTVADANLDGRFELYQCDRTVDYNPSDSSFLYGGKGIHAYDAHTLQLLWKNDQVLCSSQCPVLADVNRDGILDVIVADQSGGLAVLNSFDGSVIRWGEVGWNSHTQITVCDVDGDGHLEAISCSASVPRIWDLSTWRFDGYLAVECYEPPKVGDVTGDSSKPDIIAVTGPTNLGNPANRIIIYNYVDGSYRKIYDFTASGLPVPSSANACTLLQDVDGDGLNELVVTSQSGQVYCYNTQGRAATDPKNRVRSSLQFYSEYKRGVAEYVPLQVTSPPTQRTPSLSFEGEDLVCVNIGTADAGGHTVTNTYSWYKNGNSFSNLILPFDTRSEYTVQQSSLLKDGFETGFGNWNGNGATNWDRSQTTVHSGTYSAHATSSSYIARSLTTDNIDASQATGIMVSFWYRESYGSQPQSNIYLQFWSGSYKSYLNIFRIVPSAKNTWQYYSVWFPTIVSTRVSDHSVISFKRSDFRVRFSMGTSSTTQELWIDDVSIMVSDGKMVPRTSDQSGRNNDGTVYGAAWTSKGKVGGAYSFDGNDYIRVADSSSLGGGSGWSQITLEYWVNPSSSRNGARIISKNTAGTDTNGNYMTGFRDSTANVIFFGVTIGRSFVQTYSDTATKIPTGSWSHVVATYKSGDGLRIYINGVLKSSRLGVTGIIDPSPGEPLFIGYGGGGSSTRYFRGLLDEIRIYPVALSQQQIAQRYAETRYGQSARSKIVAEETRDGETWQCKITPSDSFVDGETKTSNTMKVGYSTAQQEIIVDNVDPGFSVAGPGTWMTATKGAGTGLFYGPNYRYNYYETGSESARWWLSIPTEGQWQVYAMWRSGSNRASDAPYTINHAGGSTTVDINQQLNGGVWVSLGTYHFDVAGYSVVLRNDADGVVIADAVRFLYRGP